MMYHFEPIRVLYNSNLMVEAVPLLMQPTDITGELWRQVRNVTSQNTDVHVEWCRRRKMQV